MGKRLDPDERRRQIVQAALELFAERGYGDVQLGDVAKAVGVTPNLLYHYFPGGKRELYVEVVRFGCEQTAGGMTTDPDLPLEQKTPANIAVYLDEMLAESPVYLVVKRAGASPDPEVQELVEGARGAIVSAIAANNLGTPDPPPLLRLALRSYLDFAETAVAEVKRRDGVTREQLEALLAASLRSILAAARDV